MRYQEKEPKARLIIHQADPSCPGPGLFLPIICIDPQVDILQIVV